jgi:hypothetical protein
LELADKNNSPIPTARTYHAAAIVHNYMVIIGGESSSSDLNDVWALNLDSKFWYKPQVIGLENF